MATTATLSEGVTLPAHATAEDGISVVTPFPLTGGIQGYDLQAACALVGIDSVDDGGMTVYLSNPIILDDRPARWRHTGRHDGSDRADLPRQRRHSAKHTAVSLGFDWQRELLLP